MNPDSKTLESLRKAAGLLLEQVVDEAIDCRWALVHWPVPVGQRCHDEALNVAYQALWHFYSDDAALSQEAFYLDVQLNLLKRLAYHLQRNEDLPLELLMGYRLSPTEQVPRFYAPPTFQQQVEETLAEFTQNLLSFKQLWQESVVFLKQVLEEGFAWPKENNAFEDWRTLRQWRRHSEVQLKEHLKEPSAQTVTEPSSRSASIALSEKFQPQAKRYANGFGSSPSLAVSLTPKATLCKTSSVFQPLHLKMQ